MHFSIPAAQAFIAKYIARLIHHFHEIVLVLVTEIGRGSTVYILVGAAIVLLVLAAQTALAAGEEVIATAT